MNRGFVSGEVKLLDLEEEEAEAEAARSFYANQEFGSLTSGGKSDASGSGKSTSFSNPHYLSPEVQAMVDRKKEIRSNVLLRDDSHQSFANALNSPADSLFSDFQDFNNRLNQV